MPENQISSHSLNMILAVLSRLTSGWISNIISPDYCQGRLPLKTDLTDTACSVLQWWFHRFRCAQRLKWSWKESDLLLYNTRPPELQTMKLKTQPKDITINTESLSIWFKLNVQVFWSTGVYYLIFSETLPLLPLDIILLWHMNYLTSLR